MSDVLHHVGVVAIGRNEGERMVRCLESALTQVANPKAVVYVDSGSTDGSADRARAMGATVVDLDLSVAFTAARARNAGLAELRRQVPSVEYVQFVDADCEIVDGWLASAIAKLEGEAKLAGVCGRRRERHPEASPYNQLCDLEWDTPVGPCESVGGDAMFRIQAIDTVGGYDPSLIAGEEPEMCVRLRENGWTLYRMDHEMTLHDAAMFHFGQWWKRAVRCGHAQIEVSQKHKASEKRIWAKQTMSTFVWAIVPPLLAIGLTIGLAVTAGGWWTLLGVTPLFLYPMLFAKVTLRRRNRDGWRTAALYAGNVTLAKFPQLVGQLKWLRGRVTGKREKLIEYKAASRHPASSS